MKISNATWLPLVLNVTVALLVTAALVQRTATMLRAGPAPTESRHSPAQSVDVDADLESLLAAGLFGRPPSTTERPEVAPLTPLKLVLRGVVDIKDSGLALISVEDGPDQMFIHGEEILPGAVLAVIQSDRIVVQRNGMFETVMLQGTELVANIEIVATTAPAVAGPASIARDSSDKPLLVSRASLLTQVRTPQELLSQAVLVPNAGGGFLLKEVRPGSLVEQFGLRAGDVVRSSNGQALVYADDIRKAYEQVAQARELKLELYRNGKPKMLRYEIR